MYIKKFSIINYKSIFTLHFYIAMLGSFFCKAAEYKKNAIYRNPFQVSAFPEELQSLFLKEITQFSPIPPDKRDELKVYYYLWQVEKSGDLPIITSVEGFRKLPSSQARLIHNRYTSLVSRARRAYIKRSREDAIEQGEKIIAAHFFQVSSKSYKDLKRLQEAARINSIKKLEEDEKDRLASDESLEPKNKKALLRISGCKYRRRNNLFDRASEAVLEKIKEIVTQELALPLDVLEPQKEEIQERELSASSMSDIIQRLPRVNVKIDSNEQIILVDQVLPSEEIFSESIFGH